MAVHAPSMQERERGAPKAARPRLSPRAPGRRAHKPSSVPATVTGTRAAISHLGPPSPEASSDTTRKLGRAALGRFPIRSCSGWGLPCDRRYRRPGELLPHPFTLTARPGGGAAVCSLWHFPRGRPHQALPGILPCGARTFLPRARLGGPAGDRSCRSDRAPITAPWTWRKRSGAHAQRDPFEARALRTRRILGLRAVLR